MIVDQDLIKALKKQLIDDDLTYRAWLEQRVRAYLARAEAEASQ